MTGPLFRNFLLVCFAALPAGAAVGEKSDDKAPDDGKTIALTLRSRTESPRGSGVDRIHTRRVEWNATKTAVVVCDLWDKHWCEGATRRVGEMAPRVNGVLVAARQKGALIIHCPSDTMDFYKETPQRKLALAAPVVEPKVPLKRSCPLDPTREGPLPIDDSDGGCDCATPVRSYKAWSRQIETLKIEPGDAIAEGPEAYYLMRQRGIENVLVLGVHTNMCVLARSFSIRQLVSQGMNVVLLRDLTDTMYNPARAPYVSHFTGTDLVVEHIEKYWCPTATSADLLGGQPFRFAEDKRPHLVLVMAEDEYHTERTLPAFARQHLGKYFRVSAVHDDEKNRNSIPEFGLLDEADVAVLSIRRRVLPEAQMAALRRFLQAGKPLVAVRTTCHAFALPNNKKPDKGLVDWPTFDRDVLGCSYQGHHGAELPTLVRTVPAESKNPILAGMPTEEFRLASSLYKVLPLGEGVTPLLLGHAGDREPHEPVAWTRVRPGEGRIFATTLGHSDDFQSTAFQRLLLNGTCWAAKLSVLDRVPVSDAAPPK